MQIYIKYVFLPFDIDFKICTKKTIGASLNKILIRIINKIEEIFKTLIKIYVYALNIMILYYFIYYQIDYQ